MIAEQYFPSFVTGYDQRKTEFNNSKELLNTEWVKIFAKDEDFYRFSISVDNDTFQHSLMAELNGGYKWFVVAYIRDKDITQILDLPKFEVKYKKITDFEIYSKFEMWGQKWKLHENSADVCLFCMNDGYCATIEATNKQANQWIAENTLKPF